MDRDTEYLHYEERARALSRGTRLRIIESRLLLTSTLCTVAELQIEFGKIKEARFALERITAAAQNVRSLAQENGDALVGIDSELRAIESRLQDLETKLRSVDAPDPV